MNNNEHTSSFKRHREVYVPQKRRILLSPQRTLQVAYIRLHIPKNSIPLRMFADQNTIKFGIKNKSCLLFKACVPESLEAYCSAKVTRKTEEYLLLSNKTLRVTMREVWLKPGDILSFKYACKKSRNNGQTIQLERLKRTKRQEGGAWVWTGLGRRRRWEGLCWAGPRGGREGCRARKGKGGHVAPHCTDSTRNERGPALKTKVRQAHF